MRKRIIVKRKNAQTDNCDGYWSLAPVLARFMIGKPRGSKMYRAKVVAIAAALTGLSGSPAWAAGRCSHFEQQVFDAAQGVAAFQHGEKFIEYGWSVAGPYNGWLRALQKLRDDPQNVRLLMVEYGFTPMVHL